MRLPCLLLAVLVACGAPPSAATPPLAPGPDHEPVGVQVWNACREPISCRITAEADDGRVVVLAAALQVPVGRRDVDASLGDDPNRAREVGGWLPPGRWRLVVAVGDRIGRSEVQWPQRAWGIAHVGVDRVRIEPRDGPVRLE